MGCVIQHTNQKHPVGVSMGSLMQDMKKNDGSEISIFEGGTYWKVTMSNASGCLVDKNFQSFSEAETYARVLSGIPDGEVLPWEYAITNALSELK